MIEAIIYHSKTGFSKKYAEMLSQELNLKYYNIKEGREKLLENTEVIFVGGIFVTKVRGLTKALRYFNVKYVLGVGMVDYSEEYEANIFAGNMSIPDKFYYLPGGLNYSQSSGIDKLILFIMDIYYKRIEKDAIKKGKELIPKDKDILNMFKLKYVDKVSKKYLEKFLSQFVM